MKLDDVMKVVDAHVKDADVRNSIRADLQAVRKQSRKTEQTFFVATKKQLNDKDAVGSVPNQMRQVLAALAKASDPLTPEQVDEQAVAAGMKTRQAPGKIFNFYRRRLLDGGFIKQATPKQATPKAA